MPIFTTKKCTASRFWKCIQLKDDMIKQGQTVHKRRRCIERQKYNQSMRDQKQRQSTYRYKLFKNSAEYG